MKRHCHFVAIIMMMMIGRSVRSLSVAKSRGALLSFRRTTTTTTTTSIRSFPSIDIYNEQDDLKINTVELENTVKRIRSLLGYDSYSIQIILVDDETMQERNLESLGVNEPTDILSFSFLESIQPGTLEKPLFDIPEYYNLGDCIVDVPYVMRRCQEDYDYYERGNPPQDDSSDEDEEDDDDEDDDDRGVSGAMATVYDPEKRIRMLMVHGMLHLVGYDHIQDDDYYLMVAKEEEILKELGMLEAT